MKNKMKKLSLLLMGGIVFSVISTGIVYRFFPQYLCYDVYSVSEGDLYQKEELDIYSGSQLKEYFVPRYDFLIGVSIGVKREDNDNEIIGRLLNNEEKMIAESSFSVRDVAYDFMFQKWVEPGQEYQLEILFPEENQSAVVITFESNDSASTEHNETYFDGTLSDKSPYICYIYGTYKKKLLAIWLIVLFLCGFMIGETILYEYEKRNLKI